MEVYVDDDSKLTLHGLQQHYVKLKDNEKNRKLFDLLDALEFNQVIWGACMLFILVISFCCIIWQGVNLTWTAEADLLWKFFFYVYYKVW